MIRVLISRVKLYLCRNDLKGNKSYFELAGLSWSERFEVDGWVVKVSGHSRDILFKKHHRKEMLSRVAGRYEPSRQWFSPAVQVIKGSSYWG